MLRATLTALGSTLLLTGCGTGESRQAEAPPKPPTPATESGRANHFAVEPFARGLNRPTWVGVAPGGTAVWALEQPGRVVRIEDGHPLVALDLRKRTSLGAEQGLLGMAFHPDFASNHLLYLSWTDTEGDSRVAEFKDTGGALDETRQLLFVDQPEENHNGGDLVFGPDGRLYLGLGDGGGAFDPYHNAQNPDTLLGKIVATPVDGKPDWQVILSGLRNPWRFSFDPALGELWVGDVGQDEVEEVNRVLLELDEPPKNLGWNIYEGTGRTASTHELEGDGDVVWPVAVYGHDDGCSITGGSVYHGTALPGLDRRYVYGDYCTGKLWTLEPEPGRAVSDVLRERATVPQLSHIGTDADGELLFASGAGTLYRAVPASSAG
jgi:glucose/arabinose dehydrogenase